MFSDISIGFPATKLFNSTGPLEKAVETNPNAIAMTGISSARLRNVKIISLDNITPDYANMKRGAYAFYRPLYITYNTKSSNIGEIKKFIKFAHSQDGRQIMKDNGVVPYMDALRLLMIQSRESMNSQNNSDQVITY
jgi:phosphate transport system substrate-binding protein